MPDPAAARHCRTCRHWEGSEHRDYGGQHRCWMLSSFGGSAMAVGLHGYAGVFVSGPDFACNLHSPAGVAPPDPVTRPTGPAYGGDC